MEVVNIDALFPLPEADEADDVDGAMLARQRDTGILARPLFDAIRLARVRNKYWASNGQPIPTDSEGLSLAQPSN